MGTVMQKMGLNTGKYPELLNIDSPEAIGGIHSKYAECGSNVVYANTFGANRLKTAGCGKSVKELIEAAVSNAKKAVAGKALVALDIGPIGKLLEPLGSLSFEEAYDIFKEMVEAGRDADLIAIETMADLYEAKAALLAAKENSNLPVIVTMSFEKNGRTYTGCTAESAARTLTALGADAIGVNCSLGPDTLAPIIRRIAENTTLPVAAKPNAGLPDPMTGEYSMSPEAFALAMKACIEAGATLLGGCCGTGYEYIEALSKMLKEAELPQRVYKRASFVCTPTVPCYIDGVAVIGERINPTGKKRFQQALLEQDMDYILQLGIQQMDAGAQILDVNVGYPGVDEKTMLPMVVKKLQSAIDLPLQLDSTNAEALEAGLRVYNGIAVVNSVNGEKESLEKILPVVKKYGACVVGLALDGAGVPDSADKRMDIARRILGAAREHGIADENLWIDCLTLTVSAQAEQAGETLDALRRVKSELGLKTVLGVSNISFGMPNRGLINRTFLAQAFAAGLDMPIMNPNISDMMDVVAAHRVLSCEDKSGLKYVELYSGVDNSTAAAASALKLEDAVMRGLDSEAAKLAKQLLADESELDIVQKRLIPALDIVGERYEKGTMFLPQLLSAAQAAQAVFEVLRLSMAEKGSSPIKKGCLALATVKGDIHDIGKNIIKTILENYGYDVIDLGKDVSPETICGAVIEKGIRLVGLSALMTTTLPAMEESVRQLKALPNPPEVMVGGAVVTADYAASIGAEYYGRDARDAVEMARRVFG
ncbi:MAG: homocysteine S-methyltransferase family protein [Oscillospiraceae bacterium]|nr:homocysteine S-methyltransferase family protein [Oscillospiraceae bacterium]